MSYDDSSSTKRLLQPYSEDIELAHIAPSDDVAAMANLPLEGANTGSADRGLGVLRRYMKRHCGDAVTWAAEALFIYATWLVFGFSASILFLWGGRWLTRYNIPDTTYIDRTKFGHPTYKGFIQPVYSTLAIGSCIIQIPATLVIVTLPVVLDRWNLAVTDSILCNIVGWGIWVLVLPVFNVYLGIKVQPSTGRIVSSLLGPDLPTPEQYLIASAVGSALVLACGAGVGILVGAVYVGDWIRKN